MKPVYSEMFLCRECGSGDTVALELNTEKLPDYVCWCSCGAVSVRADGEEKTVFDFYKEKER